MPIGLIDHRPAKRRIASRARRHAARTELRDRKRRPPSLTSQARRPARSQRAARADSGFASQYLGTGTFHPCRILQPVAASDLANHSPRESKIVVGVTDHPAARHALRWAFATATLNEAVLIVVTAYSFPRAAFSVGATAPLNIHDAEISARWVQTQVLAAELPTALPSHRIHQVVVYGDPIAALLAQAHDADLLVVGRRNSRIRRLLTGSVSKGCANDATCPVVIIRTQSQASGILTPRYNGRLTRDQCHRPVARHRQAH